MVGLLVIKYVPLRRRQRAAELTNAALNPAAHVPGWHAKDHDLERRPTYDKSGKTPEWAAEPAQPSGGRRRSSSTPKSPQLSPAEQHDDDVPVWAKPKGGSSSLDAPLLSES